MIVYDETKKGRKIASGGDRKVYMYGPDHVVKISSLSHLMGPKLRQKLQRDYAICKTYFPDFIVETVDATPDGERSYVEIQPYIKGEMLSRRHAQNPRVRSQLGQIERSIERMVKDGHAPIDLIGHAGMLGSSLSNIIVDEHDNLKIIDATLLEAKSVGIMGILLEPLFAVVRTRQKYRLRRFLR